MGEERLQNLTEGYIWVFFLELYVKTGIFCGVLVNVRCRFAWIKGYLEHWRESITRYVWGCFQRLACELVGKIQPQCRRH